MPLRITLMLLCFLASHSAVAHKLNLFTFIEDGKVYVEGYFADGKRAKHSAVTIYNANSEIINEGATNEDGEYQFEANTTDTLRIVLNAGMGHVAEYTLSGEEVTSIQTSTPSIASSTEASPQIDQHALEAMISKAVNNAVKPLAREISELKSQTSFSDIVGGFGFIIGILGIFAYITARKEKEKANSNSSRSN